MFLCFKKVVIIARVSWFSDGDPLGLRNGVHTSG